MKEINGVCRECGITANVLTCLKEYGKRPAKLCFNISTAMEGKCDYCGKKAGIVSVRDYFYPDFSLIKKTARLLKANK